MVRSGKRYKNVVRSGARYKNVVRSDEIYKNVISLVKDTRMWSGLVKDTRMWSVWWKIQECGHVRNESLLSLVLICIFANDPSIFTKHAHFSSFVCANNLSVPLLRL